MIYISVSFIFLFILGNKDTSTVNKKRKRLPSHDSSDTDSLERQISPFSANRFIPKAGRPNTINQNFPMDQGQYQYRTIFMLSNIRTELRTLSKQILIMQQKLSAQDISDEIYVTAESVEDILDFNERLDDTDYARNVRNAFDSIAFSCSDVKGHIRSILNSCMSLNVQQKVNLVYGNNVPNQNYTDRISLQRDLPKLLICILSSIQRKFPKSSEKEIKSEISEFLKTATK
jgi:hypothetical protein